MNKLISILLFYFILINFTQVIFASQFSFDGEIRERFEIWDGLNKKTYGDESFDFKGKRLEIRVRWV